MRSMKKNKGIKERLPMSNRVADEQVDPAGLLRRGKKFVKENIGFDTLLSEVPLSPVGWGGIDGLRIHGPKSREVRFLYRI